MGFAPHAGMYAKAYAGAGIAGVSVGLEGTVRLINLTLPLKSSAELTREEITEYRWDYVDLTDFAGMPQNPDYPPRAWRWHTSWDYGAALKMETLEGQIDGVARIDLLFYSKTFRKKLVDWKGFEWNAPLIGATNPDNAGSLDELIPVGGDEDLGDYGDRVPYLMVPKVPEGVSSTDPHAETQIEVVCIPPPR